MATTSTLETSYWKDKAEYQVRTKEADTYVRIFRIPIKSWDTLKPAIADTLSSDTTQIVAKVERQDEGAGAANCKMVVTYIVIKRKAALSNGYAETRRVIARQNGETNTVTYGIATSTSASGIPAKETVLDGGTLSPTTDNCYEVVLDDQTYAGLVLVTARYKALIAYA